MQGSIDNTANSQQQQSVGIPNVVHVQVTYPCLQWNQGAVGVAAGQPILQNNPAEKCITQGTPASSLQCGIDPFFMYGQAVAQSLMQKPAVGRKCDQHRKMQQPGIGEEPIYVNSKQYHAILRRRLQRAKQEQKNRAQKQRKPYLHESRHNHALRRVRGKGGKFLSAVEAQAVLDASSQQYDDLVQKQDGLQEHL
eukprot:TRINITY_DN15445_c1_g1_i2.p2 TRINITY_DN15445_c1_g1~~TRINITY_DN15445_c1_g1_i2.p2  ORF type:complete len:209 (+),score=18.47 TRINITY_DN15445_c1_g1_i2:44-628(+)